MKQVVTPGDGLIRTKLHAPAWDQGGVHRKSLIDDFCRPTGPSLFSIVAAAGSGKSTLMSQLLHHAAEHGMATAWISLEKDDNDPASFAAYLIAAVAGLADAARGQFEKLQLDSHANDVEKLFELILMYLSELSFPAIIFFDDFQHIDDSLISRFVDRLISRLPRNLKLVIASRSQLPIELGRLRVSGQLTEIDQEHLNFGTAEAVHFLEKSHDIRLGLSDMSRLMDATEGWVAGLQLAALALRRRKGNETQLIAEFSGRDRDLMSYLAETVLSAQPTSVRRFLLATAPLRRMSPELCQAVSDHPKSGEMLAVLDQQKLFLIRLDRSGQWFRYHHLFGDFLQKLLLDSEPDRHREICEKAARWCEAQGLITEAIQYSMDARQFENAANMIAEHGIRVALYAGDHYTILDWMRRLPAEYQMLRPEIKLCHAWSLAFSRHAELPLKLASEVTRKLDAENPTDGWTLDDVTRSSLRNLAQIIQAIASGSADDLKQCHDRAIALCSGTPDSNPAIAGSAANCVSYSSLANGDYAKAVEFGNKAIRDGERVKAGYVSVWGHFLGGIAELEMANPAAAAAHGGRARAAAEQALERRSFTRSMAALLNAEVASYRGEFAAARDLMEVGRTFALLFGPVEPLIYSVRNDARISFWLGDRAEALSRLEEGRETAVRCGYERLHLHLAIEEVVLLLTDDQSAQARDRMTRYRIVEQAGSKGGAQGTSMVRTEFKLLDARLALAMGEYDRALESLTSLQYSLGTACPGSLLMRIRSFKSLALWTLGRTADAMRELDRALASAAEQGCVYPILWVGRRLQPILDEISKRRAEVDVGMDPARETLIRVLSTIFDGGCVQALDAAPAATNPAAKASTEALTPREIELLRMAGSGLSNKRLAKALLITEATVKWHMHNIYGKLGVGNRTAATAKARELLLF